MAKSPVAGHVKTRLIPAMGKFRAAMVYRSLLDRTIRELSLSDHYRVVLSCSPDTTHPQFRHYLLRLRTRLWKQPTGHLGRRMYRIISLSLQNYENVIIVGSDVSNLSYRQVESAFSSLSYSDLVLGLTKDGGYGLIGMKRAHSYLFRNMSWSTAKVARLTRERIRRSGLKLVAFEGLLDVDTLRDYRNWMHSAAGMSIYRHRTDQGNDWAS